PLAILAAVFGTGLFYIVVTYAQTLGFGLSRAGIASFAQSAAPLDDLARHYVGRLMAVLLDFGATISAFASALGTANAGARILYAMGRDGFIFFTESRNVTQTWFDPAEEGSGCGKVDTWDGTMTQRSK
ncbi:MAG: hypothetical protein K6T61_07050, partial [Bryobacteraceae bacterium]|nr:hypothetical protein [Bryobacteraceae bacterium]